MKINQNTQLNTKKTGERRRRHRLEIYRAAGGGAGFGEVHGHGQQLPDSGGMPSGLQGMARRAAGDQG